MFLMIQNDGLCPVEGFTILGISTSRGEKDKIGQFGSGAKHGVLTALRAGINPIIYIGADQLSFKADPVDVGGKKFRRVSYTYKGVTEKLSIALEFGELDWTNVEMGLREFVSNALDAGGEVVEVKGTVEAQEGTTRVYLPMTPDVVRFYSTLKDRFLHFRQDYDPTQMVMEKPEEGKGKVYRCGVFVRETNKNAVLNYNLGADVKIDESRNMAEYSVKEHSARVLEWSTPEVLEYLFRKLPTMADDCFEAELNAWMIKPSSPTKREDWIRLWKKIFGDSVVASKLHGPLVDAAHKKGRNVIVVPLNWYQVFSEIGVPDVLTVPTGLDDKGRKLRDADLPVARRIWEKLEKKGLTNGRPYPTIKVFTALVNEGQKVCGYWKNGIVYINEEDKHNKVTILEELAHHITGSADFTRDFQDFVIRVAATFI